MIGGLFMVLLFLTGLFLILLVLVQRGRGGGLAGAFGGMGGQSAFGTKAGDLFTRITIVTATFWIVLCAASVKYFSEGSRTPLAPGLGKSATTTTDTTTDTTGGATRAPESKGAGAGAKADAGAKAGTKADSSGGGETTPASEPAGKSGASVTPAPAADTSGTEKAK